MRNVALVNDNASTISVYNVTNYTTSSTTPLTSGGQTTPKVTVNGVPVLINLVNGTLRFFTTQTKFTINGVPVLLHADNTTTPSGGLFNGTSTLFIIANNSKIRVG